uniref:RNA-directed DNA polymerase n=1 Tax=Haemonchus contortus TaxID=6289 RepID=A0A7I4Z6K0_HAECO
MVVCREQRAPMQREMVEEDINEVLMEEQQNTPPELKHAIEERCRKTHNEEDISARRSKQVKYEHAVQNMSADSRNIAFQETACPTGPTSACSWQKHGTTQRATSAHVDTEGCRSLGMSTREVTGASDLIGTQIVMEINLLEESYKALVDTGVTPFGLITSPPVFQRFMNTVLGDLLGCEVFCYIDDIMVCTTSKQRHLQLLEEVFQRLTKAGLRLKAKKCHLLKSKVAFLGHVIDGDGVHMDPEKVSVIQDYPVPQTVKQLRSFLGMASFYRKFCLGFSKQESCLFSLTSSKKKWSWEKEHQEAFQKMKDMICSAQVLKQPDVDAARSGTKPFCICTDASTYGLGAVLSQEGEDKQIHPIFFASKSLSKAEKRYHVTDLEALAVVFAIRRFHMFIYGLPTIIMTNHQPLTALFKRTNVSPRVLRWSLELQRYNLEIRYVKGKANVVADALSRSVPTAMELESLEGENEAVVNAATVEEESEWMKELRNDPQLGELIGMIEKEEWDQEVRMTGEKYPSRVADFALEGKGLKRGAMLLSLADKGHLQFQCVDDCFAKTTLSDIEGIQFPGAYGGQPFGDPWTAWKTASIFIRKELNTMQKVELVRNRAVSLDTEALRKVLMVAYSVCTEWTEFICTTRSIAKHESIDQNCVIDFYRIAFEDLKKELQKDEREARSLRKGPTGFAAPKRLC